MTRRPGMPGAVIRPDRQISRPTPKLAIRGRWSALWPELDIGAAGVMRQLRANRSPFSYERPSRYNPAAGNAA
jgi:hypothetical protein